MPPMLRQSVLQVGVKSACHFDIRRGRVNHVGDFCSELVGLLRITSGNNWHTVLRRRGHVEGAPNLEEPTFMPDRAHPVGLEDGTGFGASYTRRATVAYKTAQNLDKLACTGVTLRRRS